MDAKSCLSKAGYKHGGVADNPRAFSLAATLKPQKVGPAESSAAAVTPAKRTGAS